MGSGTENKVVNAVESPFKLPTKPAYSEGPLTMEMKHKLAQLEASHTKLKRRMQEMAELEASHDALKRQLEDLMKVKENLDLHQNTLPVQQAISDAERESSTPPKCLNLNTSAGTVPGEANNANYINILEEMGQSVYIFRPTGEIMYWNGMAEQLFGYNPSEALGHNVVELLCRKEDFEVAASIVGRLCLGEAWTGQFPLRKKSGEVFTAVVTNTPLYDDDRRLSGVIGVASDIRFSTQLIASSPSPGPQSISSTLYPGPLVDHKLSLGLRRKPKDWQQPWQLPFASSISSLAAKVFSRLKVTETTEKEGGSASSQELDSGNSERWQRDKNGLLLNSASFGSSSMRQTSHRPNVDWTRGGSSFNRGNLSIGINTKADAWVKKTGLNWPWPNEREWVEEQRPSGATNATQPFGSFAEKEHVIHGHESDNHSGSSTGSNTQSSTRTEDYASEGLDYQDFEILWEDLTLGEKIGEGASGTVYHGLWLGSDVAVKLFTEQEHSTEVLSDFKKEVSIMRRVRHPNILLFMGAVIVPPRLSIVTEFLPRGSLFRLLHRNTQGLDWKRRLKMALDIARGLNYLHHLTPPIIHRDLKSSNLLVDKNFTVKVGDFGLSRFKNSTYLTAKSGRGTPQWMAPEVLRDEPSNEASDVYSFGVILWELATAEIPWSNLNPMQVVGAVGFMNRRLHIPETVDKEVAAVIKACWSSDPRLRPTVESMVEIFKDMNKSATSKSARDD